MYRNRSTLSVVVELVTGHRRAGIVGAATSALVLGVTGCTAGAKVDSQPVASPLPPAVLVAQPVGRRTTVLYDNGTRDVWTVKSFDGTATHFESDNGQSAVTLTPFQSATSWAVARETGSATVIAGDPLALFPLEVGKSATWTRQGVNNGEAFTSYIKCSVVGQERVSPPIGATDTFKVVCTSGGNRSKPYATETYWYSPQLADTVIHKYSNTNGLHEGGSIVAVVDP